MIGHDHIGLTTRMPKVSYYKKSLLGAAKFQSSTPNTHRPVAGGYQD